MTAWQLVRTHLAADSAVTSIATGGIYPVRGKQGEQRPQVVGRQVTGEAPDNLDGSTSLAQATLEIACVTFQNYDGAVTLYEAVRGSLRAMRQATVSGKRVHGIQIGSVRDEDNAEYDWYAIVFTVVIRHQI